MFGKDHKKYFLLDDNIININNGSFSSVHTDVYKKSEKIRFDIMSNISKFKMEADEHIAKSQSILGKYINTNPNNIAFTSSTTESLNAVLRSIIFMAGDEIVVDADIYPTTMRILEFVCGRAGARINKVHIPINSDENTVLDKYDLAINPRTRLLVVEDIKAIDGLKNPLKKIIPIFKDMDIPILVDGAHSVGMIDLNVDELGVDWYLGCCHKWLLSAKGAGFIVTEPHNHSMMRSMRISYTYEKPYPHRFHWVGTNDYTPWLTIGLGIDVINKLGQENISNYCNDLVIEAGKLMSKEFGVDYSIPNSLSTYMTVVKLPKKLQDKKIGVEKLQEIFFNNGFNTKIVLIDNVKYIRISAYIYNDITDYEKFCDVVSKLCDGKLI